MTFTIRRSTLVVLVCLVAIAAGVFVAQRASAASATPVVYVATGENFPDALGAASAAAVQGGPILLVRQNSIPEATKGELSRLKPDVIYIAGGSDVVSDGVLNQLKSYAGSVIRVQGDTRYETAVEVSKSAFPVTSGGNTAALEARIAALEALLAGVTRNSDTLLFTGMNLQVVNGQGQTDSKNTLGNVVIGYNEQYSPADRSGSHYLIIGENHSYATYGGIVAGYDNDATGNWASVLGGIGNTASGEKAVVLGGMNNDATGSWAAVSGGHENSASFDYASVTGGYENTAAASAASVTGGQFNIAWDSWSSVTGGYSNVANGESSSVCGGLSNTASGLVSAVSGGNANTASGYYASVSGGYNNTASGLESSILGGNGITVGTSAGHYPN